MANSDKNILITPNTGAATGTLPTIRFTGADNTPVTMRVLDNGTLSFEATAGQLFSISDGLTGSIFSVNDISGIPSIEVLDTGTVRLAQYTGNVGIGIASPTSKLHVSGAILSTSTITGSSIVRSGGSNTQFLKADGSVDSSTYITGNQSITLSGDATGSGSTAITVTLANTAVTAGTYNNVATEVRPFTVDGKGRITGVGTAVTIAPAWSSIASKPTTLSGFGITDALDTSATAQTKAGDLTISGNLTVNGTTTNLNSVNLVIEDKNIILADVATPTDITGDGGGLTLKAAADKTFNWLSATNRWTSNVGIEATSLVRTGGTSTQFLKADGSVDSSTYPRTTYSSTPPTSPTPLAGDYWINSETGVEYIYISDGNSAQWVSNDSGPTITSTRSEIATIVQNIQTAAYVLQVTDNGKYVDITTGGVAITTATAMTAGQNAVIFNNSASSQTISQGSGVTLRMAGTTNTGNRNLASYGIATVICTASNSYVISGTGLS